MEKHRPTSRFSDRVDHYIKSRPGYPPQIYEALHQSAGLAPGDQVADLGSGTGLLSRIFLDRGHPLFAIEPNPDMRQAAEALLANQPGFTSLDGRAERIPLPNASIDFVVAGQAFHWFEPEAAKAEIQRILKPGKQVALIWNSRRLEVPFMLAYERILLAYGKDYALVDQQQVVTDATVAAFYAPHSPQKAAFLNHQIFDFEGLKGRLLSSSYAPLEGEPGHNAMLAALRKAFDGYQSDDEIRFEYATILYHGELH